MPADDAPTWPPHVPSVDVQQMQRLARLEAQQEHLAASLALAVGKLEQLTERQHQHRALLVLLCTASGTAGSLLGQTIAGL